MDPELGSDRAADEEHAWRHHENMMHEPEPDTYDGDPNPERCSRCGEWSDDVMDGVCANCDDVED